MDVSTELLWAQVNRSKDVEGLGEIKKAYEYTLDRVGCDMGAIPLWQDYILFLQVPLPPDALRA